MTAIGSDHAGYALKLEIIKYLESIGVGFTDFGCYGNESIDYPVYAKAACEAILDGRCENGILICNTGSGMTMAANRFKGIRAALCHSETTAAAARDHNNANILVMGASVVDAELAAKIIKTFFETGFSNAERHIRRNNMLDEIC